MPRHEFDDFSFLPTVDSTEEEIVEREELRKSRQHQPQPETPEPEHAAAAEQSPVEEPGHEEAVFEEQVVEEPVIEAPVHEVAAEVPPELPPNLPVFVQAPQPIKKMRVFEPDAVHPAPGEGSASKALQKEPAAPAAKIEPPRQATAPSNQEEGVTLLIPRAPQAARTSKEAEGHPIVEPAASVLQRSDEAPPGESKGITELKASKDAKPFVAPKPKPDEPLDPDEVKKQHWQKLAEKIGLRTLGMSVGVHVFLLLTATFIGVSQVMNQQVDFLPGGSSPQSQAAAEALTHKVQNKRNPWLKSKPPMRKVTVQSMTAEIVLPEMPAMESIDFSQITNRMDLSKAPPMGGASQPLGMGGAGGGFGAGIGRGGKFSFVGQTATGRRVVFVVDVSGSMSNRLQGGDISRFDLLKKELAKAVSQVPMGTAYQVLFFSDFAWPHNEVDSRNSSAMEKYRWEIRPEDYKKVKIPSFKYLTANPFSLQDSVKIIQGAENPGGTNWGSGLLMALNANPKPDVIFFMTDGERQDEMGWIDIVTAENKRKLPMTAIYTSVMAQVDAAREMDSLAKRNNGRFTVVTGEGKVIKGEDFFK